MITITNAREETTAWKRFITFTFKGKEYSTTIYWDEYDGYDIMDWDIYEMIEKELRENTEDQASVMNVASHLDLLSYNFLSKE